MQRKAMDKKCRQGLIALMISLVLLPAGMLACGCVSIDGPRSIDELVSGAVRGSNAVFSGTVIRFEFRKGISVPKEVQGMPGVEWETKVAVFSVDQWWKMPAFNEMTLITKEMRGSDGSGFGSSCDYHFKIGETYLVFADGSEDELRTHSCSNTRTLGSISRDFLDTLGKGNLPIKKFEAEKPKVSSFWRGAAKFDLLSFS